MHPTDLSLNDCDFMARLPAIPSDVAVGSTCPVIVARRKGSWLVHAPSITLTTPGAQYAARAMTVVSRARYFDADSCHGNDILRECPRAVRRDPGVI
jgi:hypothetical protein